MNTKFTIKLFYIIYTLYIVFIVDVTSIKLWYILPSVILMWINYFIFSAGYRFRPNKINNKADSYSEDNLNQKEVGWLNNQRKITLLVIAFTSLVSSILAAKYYTGQSPIDVINNLRNGVSTYYQYQMYFRANARNVLTLSKLPYVFMMFFTKLTLFYSYFSIFYKNKIAKFDVFYIMLITISYLYIGIARGTNYEFFEFVMLIIIIIFSDRKIKTRRAPMKKLVKVSLIVLSMIFLFYSSIIARGVIFNNYISSDVYFNTEGIISSLFPTLAFIILILYSYFGFGFYYISSYISEVWSDSIQSFFAGVIPYGYIIKDGISIQDHMRSTVDMGTRWHPDTAGFINDFGLIGLILFCFILGFILESINRNISLTPMARLTSFIILLQMISLPVGNFVTVSSSSRLIVLVVLFYWIWKKVIKHGIRGKVKS